jgi:ribosomal protein S18 acetylase RimI-like enzyme
MTVAIRRALPDEYQAICDLIPDDDELFLVYPKGRHPLTVGQLAELLEQRMEPTILLSECTTAGFGDLYGYRAGRSAFIGNVIVDPLRRGRGFGRMIISHLIDLAFDRYDLRKVRISVYSHNARALLLYASLGFKPYAIRAEKDLSGDRVALIHLSLKRGSSPIHI